MAVRTLKRSFFGRVRGWEDLVLMRSHKSAFLTRMGPSVNQEELPLLISFSERKR